MAQTDREALVALYVATDGPNWTQQTNWGSGAPLSDWHGVTTNDQDRVLELHLETNNLQGTIPAQLGHLNKLTWLDLSQNQLSGTIPPELEDLVTLLKLDLSWNKLSGPIPPELGTLAALQSLWLDNNQLTGSIPPELGNLGALQHLNLHRNQLSGGIPVELGGLSVLKELSLSNNQLRGPIPQEIVNHKIFEIFSTGLARDGPPLPRVNDEWHAIKILVVPVLLGYFDLGSDLYTAVSYYQSDHPIWFALGLLFALGPAIIVSVFFLRGSGLLRRFLVATQLSLVWEAWVTVEGEEYSDILALVRVVEPLFESVPQLMLQLYALLVLWDESSSSQNGLVWRVVSVCISATSLAYAATDVCSVERLLYTRERVRVARFRVFPRCPSLTGIVFSRVPEEGSSALNGLGKVHPRSHVWLCFVYHVLEIVSRFVSLSMLALVMREWFFLVLPYLWGSRCLLVWMVAVKSGGQVEAVEDFRFRVRMVAMPFLDSVMDGTFAYASGLMLTLVEFIVSLVMYRFYRDDDLPSSVRLVLNVVAVSCMLGKICLALIAMFPLKEDRDGSRGIGDAGENRSTTLGRGWVITDDAVISAEMTAMEGGKVGCEIAPSEGRKLQLDADTV
ncbi:unnamed protein product [Ectocarpus sp. 12 AP-2014]